eukprot:CAMPEP_0197560118 /NCGR_PEP_ID=MMETSP1320-20131121/22514_1 /TAXON_ID=91990 /ORGANISM="Bolidomonas sp., Strain RCC2347" /LENGTH=1008 /DNA_ID=CAMNT_0043121641 /DNA_START=116 /DNA_END=3139 /DNA_ORIENTATION=+
MTSPSSPSLEVTFQPSPPRNPSLRMSRTDSPRGSRHTLSNGPTPQGPKSAIRRDRSRSSSFEPQTLDSAKEALDHYHSRAEEFSDMLELLMQIGKGATLRDAETSIMAASCDILKADRSDVFVYDIDEEVLKSRTRVGRRETEHAALTHHEVEIDPESDKENLVAYVYRTAEIVCTPGRRDDEESEWDLSFLRSEAEIFGFIAAPIMSSDEQVAGVIVVFNKSKKGEIFSDTDIFSIEQISRFASNAFKAWESIYAAQHAKQRMETLVGMIKHISNETDTNMVIDKMFQMSRSILNAEGITLFELIRCSDSKIGESQLRISKSTVGDAIGMTFSISEGIAGHVARTGEYLNIKDPYSDPRFSSKADKSKGFKTRSILCVPVFQQGTVVAVIQAINKRNAKFFNDDDIHLLQYLSDSTGISLAQAALFHQVIRDRRQAQIDKIFIQVLSKRCSTHKFITNVMKAAKLLLDMQRFSLYLVDHHHREVWVTVEEENIICVPIGVGIAGIVADTGEVLNIPDAYDFPRFQRDIDLSTGFRTTSVLCMPVLSSTVDKTIIGVVQGINRLNNRGEIVPFTENDVKLMHQFCTQLSVVMRQMMMEASITKMSVDRKSAMERKSSSAVPVFSLAKEYMRDSELVHKQASGAKSIGWVLPEELDLTSDTSAARLVKSNDWDLDVLSMSDNEMENTFEISLEQFNLLENHKIPSMTVQSFISKVKENYNPNPYHCFHHAFHVFHSVHCILRSKSIGFLDSYQVLSILVAAICHDIDHPGNNNAFEKETHSVLAIRYSDDSILERHHCARAFEILNDEESNLFSSFTREEFAQCRKIVIQSILATDMSGHADLSRSLALLPDDVFETMDKDSPPALFTTFFSAILHTGDLSGQAVPLRHALKWGERVLTEFINQAEKETILNLPVAPFMSNLENPQRAANVQKGYIDFILRPWWTQFIRFFPDNQDLVKSLGYIDDVKAFYVSASEKRSVKSSIPEEGHDHARIVRVDKSERDKEEEKE